MKVLFNTICIAIVLGLNVSAHASNPILSQQACTDIIVNDTEDDVLTIRVCFRTKTGRRCVNVDISKKLDGLETLEVKAEKKNNDDFILSGFPTSLNGATLTVATPQSFDFEEIKVTLKAGKYQISSGRATLKIAK